MLIEHVRVRRVTCVVDCDGPPLEERQARPVDIYEEDSPETVALRRRARLRPPAGGPIDAHHWRATSFFVEIHTDEGVSGLAGPMFEPEAYMIQAYLQPMLIGRDPLASEMIWDRMHRSSPHGREGDLMHAISLVDCALWDLKGKWFNAPVYQLLGGKGRPAMPAYVSTLGLDVSDMGRVRARALDLKTAGFKAQKWFFRQGPSAGPEGLRKNVELVRTVREALGEDDDLMLDCWHALDGGYVERLAERIEEFRPRWIEETAMLDRPETERRVRDRIRIPVAGGEHQATRWGVRRHLDLDALDVYQCDTQWAGGVSEAMKIAALVTAHDKIFIPHGASVPTNLHVSLPQSPAHTPYVEYLLRLQPLCQTFYKSPTYAVDGLVSPNDLPGMGIDLNTDILEENVEVRFAASVVA